MPLLIERGYDVTAMTIGTRTAELANGVRWKDADLLRTGTAINVIREVRPELLLHLAWEARPGTSRTPSSRSRTASCSCSRPATASGRGRSLKFAVDMANERLIDKKERSCASIRSARRAPAPGDRARVGADLPKLASACRLLPAPRSARSYPPRTMQ